MEEFLSELLKARPDTLLIAGGLLLLLLAIAGNISDKIKAGKHGRIAAGLIGPVLLIAGLSMHVGHAQKRSPADTSQAARDGGQMTGVEAAEKTSGQKPARTPSNNGTTENCTSVADTCKQGYVWREAGPSDHVCVTPAVREQSQNENALGASRRSPGGGAYGADTCLQGYVWREAFPGDHVCVEPDAKVRAARQNSLAGTHNACS
ncbi:hypothetical protein [Occallatibacter riparius]|uniref:Uncharacterized protein n=1 Tax=Occallatibacter riparius TaxID=1002689 RepID=A0A9J7BYN9_9BACT|nr:hypothetical protein [Occallatibacter riparius]UWZ86637.1 hypothetical protein MOP44_11985 [Occallatibacter riparius]